MPGSGVRSTDLDPVTLFDDLIGNAAEASVRVPRAALATPGVIMPMIYDTPTELLASDEAERGPGRQWATREGLTYEELAADADEEDYDFETPGGARLRVLTTGGELHLDSFGADPQGLVPSTEAFRAWLLGGQRRGGGPMRASGLYLLGDPGDPDTDDDAPACFSYDVPKLGRDTEFLLQGATFRFTAGTDKWAWRIYQHGNSAAWKVPRVIGGTFDGSAVDNPLGCLLWDDIGGGESRDIRFLGWKRDAGSENAICIMQRNYSSWSEVNRHTGHDVSECDRFFDNGRYTGPGSTATDSQARTRIENIFASTAKAYLIVNRMGMYDSSVRRVRGNGQKIGVFRNDGGGVSYSELADINFEQGYEATTRTSGVMALGSTTLTLDGETQFQNWMAQGMRVSVSGAGVGGATLDTWITGYTSASEVTVQHAAQTAVTDATVLTYSTVAHEERSTLHQFIHGAGITARNNGRKMDTFRFTGADTSFRPTTCGALDVFGNVSSANGSFFGYTLWSRWAGKTDRLVENASGHRVWPVAQKQVALPDTVQTTIMAAAEIQEAGNMAWRVTLFGTDGQLSGECVVYRRQGSLVSGFMPISANGVTLALASGALVATQSTGASVTANVLMQRIN